MFIVPIYNGHLINVHVLYQVQVITTVLALQAVNIDQ